MMVGKPVVKDKNRERMGGRSKGSVESVIARRKGKGSRQGETTAKGGREGDIQIRC